MLVRSDFLSYWFEIAIGFGFVYTLLLIVHKLIRRRMKNKIVLVGGPFDGHVGAAYIGVTEFWKRDDNREYKYSRSCERTFRYDKKWRKVKGSTNETKSVQQLHQ